MATTDHATADRTGAPGRSWAVLLGLIIPAAVLMSVDKQAMVVLAPEIRSEFHFTIEQTTQLLSIAVGAYALFQIPAGWLCERFGARMMLGLSCVTWSMAVLLLPLGGSFAGFAVARIAMGLCQSPDWAASIMIIRERFPLALRAKASSGLLSGLYLGLVIGGPLCASLLLWFGTWRWCFVILGMIGFALSGAIFWSFRQGLRPPLVREASTLKGFDGRLFLKPQFLAIGFAYFFMMGIQSFFTILMPLYLVEVRHMNTASMGKMISVPYFFLYGAVIIMGFVSDAIVRRAPTVWFARVPLGIVGLIGAGTFQALSLSATSIPATIAFMSAAMFMIGMGQVSIWTTVQDLGRDHAGIIVGWTQLLGNGAGALVPVISAALVQGTHGDWSIIRMVIVICGLCGTIAFLLTNPQRPIVLPPRGAA
ncbi:major facilitator superfamily transporter [Ameyamaea chiangmaiensis NBRC 103196]|uniref:MFS transporter n=1 Tax=Ameyamaea chiangmaiensis TaxID=442969 RepID=A0A850PFL4_9PROT|nr:MFS transporter [Ameyamaea chiangmaiensis]MBS4073923.1 MFS transporter [Ameyamaea chiangmaiensis]NVN39921.1 MFS transporter [Ameyamaea chiangmaiensis]GBQ67916.1 major facilitator superfamily transporter [Ameyamaea chiangmaiensis NBRC 103196]